MITEGKDDVVVTELTLGILALERSDADYTSQINSKWILQFKFYT